MTKEKLIEVIKIITAVEGTANLNHFSKLMYANNQLILASKEYIEDDYEVDVIIPFDPNEHNPEWAARIILAAAF